MSQRSTQVKVFYIEHKNSKKTLCLCRAGSQGKIRSRNSFFDFAKNLFFFVHLPVVDFYLTFIFGCARECVCVSFPRTCRYLTILIILLMEMDKIHLDRSNTNHQPFDPHPQRMFLPTATCSATDKTVRFNKYWSRNLLILLYEFLSTFFYFFEGIYVACTGNWIRKFSDFLGGLAIVRLDAS